MACIGLEVTLLQKVDPVVLFDWNSVAKFIHTDLIICISWARQCLSVSAATISLIDGAIAHIICQ
jgi:hypothetical protein